MERILSDSQFNCMRSPNNQSFACSKHLTRTRSQSPDLFCEIYFSCFDCFVFFLVRKWKSRRCVHPTRREQRKLDANSYAICAHFFILLVSGQSTIFRVSSLRVSCASLSFCYFVFVFVSCNTCLFSLMLNMTGLKFKIRLNEKKNTHKSRKRIRVQTRRKDKVTSQHHRTTTTTTNGIDVGLTMIVCDDEVPTHLKTTKTNDKFTPAFIVFFFFRFSFLLLLLLMFPLFRAFTYFACVSIVYFF